MKAYPKTSRSTVKRVPKRAHYDQETVYKILDAGFICHAGFVVEGQPFVIPTIYGRDGDTLYLHGATTSRLITQLGQGIPACITVTHLDGLVLARSAFHHSANYRSVVIFGTARLLEGERKMQAFRVISDQLLKGRWEEIRQPNAKELKATSVLALTIEEATAKVRTGGPVDDEEDYALPIWAGVLPIQQQYAAPIADERLPEGVALGPSVRAVMP